MDLVVCAQVTGQGVTSWPQGHNQLPFPLGLSSPLRHFRPQPPVHTCRRGRTAGVGGGNGHGAEVAEVGMTEGPSWPRKARGHPLCRRMVGEGKAGHGVGLIQVALHPSPLPSYFPGADATWLRLPPPSKDPPVLPIVLPRASRLMPPPLASPAPTVSIP